MPPTPAPNIAPAPSVPADPTNPAAAPGGSARPAGLESEIAALESEMAELRIEKSAIEAEEGRVRAKREELEAFERDHAAGVPPELFARYEADRLQYNSDVQALKSRANVYTMRVADVERRIGLSGAAAP
ncbi:MAG TPA: hypothetical protein VFU59_09335 [Candidatus Eisenbacteria bacterium]|nr:hypothetical protein [Candidatus Eisenbacteria bacterium]